MSMLAQKEIRSVATEGAAEGADRPRARLALQIATAAMVVAIATLVVPWLVYSPDLSESDIELQLIGGGWTFQMSRSQIDLLFLGKLAARGRTHVLEFSRRTGRNAKALWAERSARRGAEDGTSPARSSRTRLTSVRHLKNQRHGSRRV